MDIKVAFGQALRAVRKEKKISQEHLALESGVDRTYISKLERGKYQPTLETILALAPVLGCPPAELVERVEKLIKSSGSD